MKCVIELLDRDTSGNVKAVFIADYSVYSEDDVCFSTSPTVPHVFDFEQDKDIIKLLMNCVFTHEFDLRDEFYIGCRLKIFGA